MFSIWKKEIKGREIRNSDLGDQRFDSDERVRNKMVLSSFEL